MERNNAPVALLLSLAMLLGLTACGGQQSTDNGLNIVICTSPNSIDDHSFNEANYSGVLSFVESRGQIDSVVALQEPSGDHAAAVQIVAEHVSDHDVFVCAGGQFDGIGTIAQNNPDKIFLLVDAFPIDETGITVTLDNVYAMRFAENESGFFAGIAAAMETKTGKIAVVNGQALPSNVSYQLGFMSGVNYANAHLETSATLVELPTYSGTDTNGNNIGGNYIGDFGDSAAARIIGDALIYEGCDIIFAAAGEAGNGVLSAAEDAVGVMVIGCDVDQYEENEDIILTSVLKNMSINVERQLTAIADGVFQGGNYTLTAKTDSTGYVSIDGHHQLSSDTLSALKSVYSLVKDGRIVPASSFNDYTPDNFPGL